MLPLPPAGEGGGEGRPLFYVGLRGHHADIGGIAPVALMYFTLCFPISLYIRGLEKKRQEINADPRQSLFDISQLRKRAPGEVFSNPKTAEMQQFPGMIQ